MAFEIVEAGLQEVDAARQQITAIYRAAFTPPPYSLDDRDITNFSRTFARHNRREDFRCVLARQTVDGILVGFAYGYTSLPGQWWREVVARELSPQAAQRWLAHAFEFVELAVEPAFQGRGLGGCLHDRLLNGLPHRTAVLSTIQGETAAIHLYRKRSWITIQPGFLFPGNAQPYLILGKALEEPRR